MKINVIAVGTRMPDWVQAGITEYSKRLPRDFTLNITEIAMGHRGKSSDPVKAMVKEGELMQQQIGRNDYVVALDVKGKTLSTEAMAKRVQSIRENGKQLALLVGGPDGLSADCLQKADERWSLSDLTLPHPIVRVVVAEQIYRVWSLLNNHPYHRA